MPAIAHPIFIVLGGFYLFGGASGPVVGALIGIIAGVVSSVIIYKNPSELKLLCKIKIHLGTWVYDSDAGCSQTHNCRRCDEKSSRVLHDVQHWEEDVEYWEPGWSPGKDYGVRELCKQRQTHNVDPGAPLL